jgi:hypothetical protein
MKHSLKDLVKNTTANLTHVCEGKVFYQILVDKTLYQLEIDSLSEDWRATYLTPSMKALHLMRWLRKGLEKNDGSLLQLN